MVSLALQDAYLQVPIHHDLRRYLRFVVPTKDVPVRSPLLRSHNLAPRLHEDYGSHFRHPPQVWTIDSSWPLQNSSLVYLGLEIRSLPFMARPPPDESAISCDYSRSFCPPHLLQRPPSLFQSQKSASYQTLRMWVAGPHRRTPRLGLFVSSSEDSLHQPERVSSSSVRPEGLRTPVGGPVGSSVLRQHHHSNVCPSPAALIMGSSNVSADALRRPIWWSGRIEPFTRR